jgi:hypothetical protein
LNRLGPSGPRGTAAREAARQGEPRVLDATTNGRVIVAPLDSEGLFCFDMDGGVAMAAR